MRSKKSYAYGIQSFLANTGAVVAAILPFVFAYIGLANTAEKGVVPQTVVVAFLCGRGVVGDYQRVHDFQSEGIRSGNLRPLPRHRRGGKSGKSQLVRTLETAPKAFWTVTLVQFFCWFAFQYMWTYSAGAIAENVWHTTDASSVGYQEAGTGTVYWRRCSRLRR